MLRGTTSRDDGETDTSSDCISRASYVSMSDEGYMNTSRDSDSRASNIYHKDPHRVSKNIMIVDL